MIRQAYSLVAIAFERLARQLELTLELAQHGQQIIAEGSNAWNASSKADADNLGSTASCLGDLENFVRDVSLSLGADGSVARDWLELGLMAAEGAGDASLPFEKRGWTSRDRQGTERRLAALGLSRSDVFPEPVDPASRGGWTVLPGHLSGWRNLEVGLMKLADVTEPGMGKAWSTSAASEKPYWDAETGELRLGGQVLRRLRVMGRPSSIQKASTLFRPRVGHHGSKTRSPKDSTLVNCGRSCSISIMDFRASVSASRKRVRRSPGRGREFQLNSNSVPLGKARTSRG